MSPSTMMSLAALLLTGALGAAAADGAEPLRVEPALAPDPAVEAVLRGLGQNCSALLPAVKTAGNMTDEVRKFGLDRSGPRPRDYCVKWVWAPDRRRALFCGANAGVPHRLNDVWEYDLPSNTWVLLWEPDPDLNGYRKVYGKGDAAFDKLVDSVAGVRDGALMTGRGAPFDPVHTWWGLTYDPNSRALLWVMGNQNKIGYKYKNTVPWGKIELWAYYPYEHRWEFIRPDGKSPPGQNASILEYLPDRRQVLWYTNSWRGCTTSMWDPATKAWKELLGKKDMQGEAFPGTEAVAAYDTKSRVLVVHHGGGTHQGKPVPRRTYHYDPAANKWEKAVESDQAPLGYDSKSPMVYDQDAEQCYVVQDGLWSYRVENRKWEKLSPQGPPVPGRGGRSGMACYNPDRKVLMVDCGSGQVWIYRAKAR